jgi:hypothetical protein
LPELIWSEAAPQVPDQKIGIVLAHPGDKNKNVARMGHPDSVQIHKHYIRWSTTGTQVRASE